MCILKGLPLRLKEDGLLFGNLTGELTSPVSWSCALPVLGKSGQLHRWENKCRVDKRLQGRINPVEENKGQYRKGGELWGTLYGWGTMKKRVMELDQNGQCSFGFLQREAGSSVMVMIISWESQEF